MLASGPVAQKAGVPFMDVGGTAPVITDLGDYIFMLPFGDNTQAAATAEFTYKKGWKNATMLMDTEWDYTKFLSKYFINRFTELGGKMLLEDTYKSGDKDFSAQLTKIKNLQPQPDFVFVRPCRTISARSSSRRATRAWRYRLSAATATTRRC